MWFSERDLLCLSPPLSGEFTYPLTLPSNKTNAISPVAKSVPGNPTATYPPSKPKLGTPRLSLRRSGYWRFQIRLLA